MITSLFEDQYAGHLYRFRPLLRFVTFVMVVASSICSGVLGTRIQCFLYGTSRIACHGTRHCKCFLNCPCACYCYTVGRGWSFQCALVSFVFNVFSIIWSFRHDSIMFDSGLFCCVFFCLVLLCLCTRIGGGQGLWFVSY